MISKLARIPEFLAWQSLVMQQNLSKEVSWLNDFSLQNYHQRMMDLAINGWPIGSEYCIRTVWPSIGSQTVKLFNIFTGHKNVPSPSAPPFHVIRPGGRWVRLGCVISPGKTRTVEAAEKAWDGQALLIGFQDLFCFNIFTGLINGSHSFGASIPCDKARRTMSASWLCDFSLQKPHCWGGREWWSILRSCRHCSYDFRTFPLQCTAIECSLAASEKSEWSYLNGSMITTVLFL